MQWNRSPSTDTAAAGINLTHLCDTLVNVNSGMLPCSRPQLPRDNPHISYVNRNNFLFLIEENGSIYESVRKLIPNPTYWKAEEAHFFVINQLIINYNRQNNPNITLSQIMESPPVEVLRNLWDQARQRGMHDISYAEQQMRNSSVA